MTTADSKRHLIRRIDAVDDLLDAIVVADEDDARQQRRAALGERHHDQLVADFR